MRAARLSSCDQFLAADESLSRIIHSRFLNRLESDDANVTSIKETEREIPRTIDTLTVYIQILETEKKGRLDRQSVCLARGIDSYYVSFVSKHVHTYIARFKFLKTRTGRIEKFVEKETAT